MHEHERLSSHVNENMKDSKRDNASRTDSVKRKFNANGNSKGNESAKQEGAKPKESVNYKPNGSANVKDSVKKKCKTPVADLPEDTVLQVVHPARHHHLLRLQVQVHQVEALRDPLREVGMNKYARGSCLKIAPLISQNPN